MRLFRRAASRPSHLRVNAHKHLLLVRHGRSALAPEWRPLDRDGVQRWRVAYDAAGLAPADRPPAGLVAEVAGAGLVAASDLPRARASAALLAQGRGVLASPLFREVPLPLPGWGPRRAPLALWEALIHVQWAADLARGRPLPPEAAAQVREAAAWCRAACTAPESVVGPVVVVTHGVFRRFLAGALVAAGWRTARSRRSYAHWSAWRFTAPPR